MSADREEIDPIAELPAAIPGYDERRRRADYRATFGSEAGRRVLADLARFAHMGHPSYVRGDAMETAFREGERNVVLRILALLRERRGETNGAREMQATAEIDAQQ